jgi:hypothetical protein
LLHEVKNKLKTEIFEFLCAYSHIDNIFTKEIKNAEMRKSLWNILFCFFNQPKKTSYDEINPVIDKYFRFIFADE